LERIAGHAAAVLVVSLGFDTYGQDPIADFALSTDVYHEVGRRVAGLGLPTLILQEGGYFVPKLGENARTWLRGLLGRPLDLRAPPGGQPVRARPPCRPAAGDLAPRNCRRARCRLGDPPWTAGGSAGWPRGGRVPHWSYGRED